MTCLQVSPTGDIDWDDFDFEEESDFVPFEKNDNLFFGGIVQYWDSSNKKWISISVNWGSETVVDVKKSVDIDDDDERTFKKGSIPFDGWLFALQYHWTWFKYDPRMETYKNPN